MTRLSERRKQILNFIQGFKREKRYSPSIREIMRGCKISSPADEKKILIVNLSKGKIGEDNCALLGAMIVTKIQLAAMSRADVPEEKRRSFYMYVDEIHNFLTQSFCDILSEARKYSLSLVLTHQYIEQLDEEVSCAVLGNIGTLITFRIGTRDAEFLKNEFHPVFNEADLCNLPNYHIYLKLMIDGVTSKPFSALTLPPPEMKTSHKDKIIKASREGFARPKVQVEKEMAMRRVLEDRVPSQQKRMF